MSKAVYGIYMTRAHAEEALDALRAAGFRAEDISALMPDNVGTKDAGYEKHSKAPESAATGATAMGLAGGVVGWLIGAGALAIPGIGPFLAAGPIVSALAGIGAGSVVGGLGGALIGLGIPEYEAKRYEGRIRSGAALVSVHCADAYAVKRAADMLRHTGAEDISSGTETSAPAWKDDART